MRLISVADLKWWFIFSSVVRTLRYIKERRQVFVVTHNANIAVLGDSEIIFPMRRDGAVGRTYERGAIDRIETKRAVQDVLEGDATPRRAAQLDGRCCGLQHGNWSSCSRLRVWRSCFSCDMLISRTVQKLTYVCWAGRTLHSAHAVAKRATSCGRSAGTPNPSRSIAARCSAPCGRRNRWRSLGD
jgi:hypothetical protein